MPTSLSRLVLCAILVLLPVRALRAEEDSDIKVDVVVDLTDAGRKVERPSPAHPAYFFPRVWGYTEGGAIMPYQQPPPAENEVLKMVAKALAQQGYYMAIAKRTPPPSLILMFWWGYKAPNFMGPDGHLASNGPIGGHGGQDINQLAQRGLLPVNVSANQKEMDELVMGSKYEYEPLQNLSSIRLENLRNATRVGRYFLMVSALDFQTYVKTRKFVVLWTARISTEMEGRTLTDVLPTLISRGSSMFGRDTDGPQMTVEPIVPMGQVILGKPVSKGEATDRETSGK
jgi:hypothetical protein